MRYGFKYRLNIEGYPTNAAKNFSFTKLIIFTVLSIILTIALLVNAINQNYQGKALFFVTVVFLAILGYSILNIKALIIKSKRNKR